MDISVRFPHFNIAIEDLQKNISVFGIEIAYYGIIVAFAVVSGYMITKWQVKRTKQNFELYLDFAIYIIVASMLGARIYYVIFSWNEFDGNISKMLNIRAGGLAIYGGIIAAVTTTFIYSKWKKVSFWRLLDTSCAGLAIGQAIGRWGNFFNREAFGRYTDCIFAMQLKRTEVSSSALANDTKYLENIVDIDGVQYIQVHPTFLYESVLCLLLGILLIVLVKYKKFDGELILVYFIIYGIGRFFIESLRTDQLLLWHTELPVSQLLSAVLAISSCVLMIFNFVNIKKENSK